MESSEHILLNITKMSRFVSCYDNVCLSINNQSNYCNINITQKELGNKKTLLEKCVELFVQQYGLTSSTMWDKKVLIDVTEIQINNYYSPNQWTNVQLSLQTKGGRNVYKLKIIGIAEPENTPIYIIATSLQTFGEIVKLVKKKYTIQSGGKFMFNGKEITTNNKLTDCNLCTSQMSVNEIIFEKKLDIKNKINEDDGTDRMDIVDDENNNNIDNIDKKIKKQTISKAKKISVWNKHVGKDKGTTLCFCCKVNEISQMNFACGHVESEANGGTLDDENLRPICTTCNSSMGTENMREFMKNQGLGDLK